jgi:hypothetical protein
MLPGCYRQLTGGFATMAKASGSNMSLLLLLLVLLLLHLESVLWISVILRRN